MFDSLSDKLQAALAGVRGRGKLSAADVERALREIRLALLEADVNLEVIKQLTEALRERCLGAEVMENLNPGQQVVKIVNEELTRLMGAAGSDLTFSGRPPTVVLMVGLQGSGKTTACAKLARQLQSQGKQVALAACDLQRPAAVEQLKKVGAQAGATVFERGASGDPVEVAAWALEQATAQGKDVLVVDTAGRLHVDDELMEELRRVRDASRPHNVLMVVDAMTGQDAVQVAEAFAERVAFDGVVMTKLDGDARGGAALSIKAVTGKPIKFVSTGEQLDAFERFHPDRMASRILGMGDVLSFIEKAEQTVDQKKAAELEQKVRKQQFTFDDFLDQMQQMRKMGPMTQVLGMLPGVAGSKELKNLKVDERDLDRLQAIVTSMTPQERRDPKIIDGSRRRRIARGSGTTVQAVNQLLKQFAQMQKMMRQLQQGKMPSPAELMRGR